MQQDFLHHLHQEIETLKASGLYKSESVLMGPQGPMIQTNASEPCINLCANNYLGLANHPDLIQAAQEALQMYGYGMASVRFICGTQISHQLLEQKLCQFLNKEDAILYSSCFDANIGLFEPLLNENDAIFSDELNHASIIDGVRLSKAARFRYQHNNMRDLEQHLQKASNARFRLIVTDGVFSMEGSFANLPAICDLAEKYKALVMVDDSHAMGFIGQEGKGTPEYWGVMERIDILTGTFGKAMGGASGGFTAGHRAVIEWLRQRSRPYLFSNSLAPMLAATTLKAFTLIETQPALRIQLLKNTQVFRNALTQLGFTIIAGEHPIIPIMLGEATLAVRMAEKLREHGVYVIAFSYPVVPLDKARIRVQMSAAHTEAELEKAIQAFAEVGKILNIIK